MIHVCQRCKPRTWWSTGEPIGLFQQPCAVCEKLCWPRDMVILHTTVDEVRFQLWVDAFERGTRESA